jgi:hypothetical protein
MDWKKQISRQRQKLAHFDTLIKTR